MQKQREADAAPGLPPAASAVSGRARLAATPEPPPRPAEVLLVCAGNVCRSPVAEAFLRRHLAALGSDVIVRSAGLRAGGQRAAPVVIKTLRRRGFRIRRYISTPLTAQLLSDADVVLGMAIEHVEAVVLMAPEKWPRVFTFKELIRRSEAVGGRRPDETVDDWLARLHAGRTLRDLRHFTPQDDIADPLGRPLAAHEEMANEVEALTKTVAGLLSRAFEPSRTGDEGHGSEPLAEADEGVQQEDDDTEENSMKADDVDADGMWGIHGEAVRAEAPVDGLGPAREALQEARQTVIEAAEQLAEVFRSANDAQRTVPVDAYTQLGEEVATVMRTAATQASVVRDDGERYARRVRLQAEQDAAALREQSRRDAAELRRTAEEESATVRREADEERKRAGIEAADLRRAATTESTSLREEADLYAKSTRSQAEDDASHIHDEADRYAGEARRTAEALSAETLAGAERDAAAMRGAADADARTTRADAEQEAAELLREASARYAGLVVAEAELRSRLEGAAGALVSALEGRQMPSPRLALPGADEEELDQSPSAKPQVLP